MKFILLIVAACVTASQGVNWNGNNWALNCDFRGNDLTHARISGAECGGRCGSTPGCTHFTWTDYQGGTCWMKQGAVCHNDAIDKQGGVCGYTKSTCGNPPNPTNHPVQSGSALKKLTNCKFAYGLSWDSANKNYGNFDYMNKWLGEPADGCRGADHCTDWNKYWAGAAVEKAKELGKTLVLYMYIIAFEAKNKWALHDCNVGHPNLCERGADYIRQFRSRIIERYEYQAKHVADIVGRNTFAVYMIEPDFVQYYRRGFEGNMQGGYISGEEMGRLFKDMVAAIKRAHPAASIAWDISPWLSESEQRTWWNYFKDSHSQIDFLFTSGGGARAESPHIHINEQTHQGEITYKFMHNLTGKPIIADTGYGVDGHEADNSGPWFDAGNLNNRVNDGVVALHFAHDKGRPGNNRNVC